jgi:protein-disulfide isomerase
VENIHIGVCYIIGGFLVYRRIKSKISDFTTENPVNSAEGISEFKSYDLIPNTLIVFYEPECGWCKRYYPVLIEAEKKYPEIDIYVPRLTENRDIASKYGITGTPSNVINGKYAVGGYMPLEGLSEVLDSLN